MSSARGGETSEPARRDTAARRLYLTLVFCDLSDSTALAAAMEAEHYADMLADVRHVYAEVVPQHGGMVVRIQGDGMLAIFGHPQPHEDDGRRATEAALRLHAAVRALRVQVTTGAELALALHTGIHTGLVLVDEGDPLRGRLDLLGNAPNLAARLSAAAQRDEILVSEAALGAERDFFDTGERRMLQVKGSSEPLAAYRILGRAPISTRFEARSRRGLLAFIGRERELIQLDRLLADCRQARLHDVVVSGAPGLGKTRLAEEFLQRAAARGVRVCRGNTDSHLGTEPLQPVLQMLRALFGLQPGMAPEAAAAAVDAALLAAAPELVALRDPLRHVLSLPLSCPETRPPPPEVWIAALRDLFESLAERQTLLLYVDDLQWADDATRQVLGALRSIQARPIMLLATTRPLAPDAAGHAVQGDTTVLNLQPFDAAEAAHTVACLLPAADPFVAQEIIALAGGNALYIEELCHAASHDRVLRRPGQGNEDSGWLDVLIESRVSRLPSGHREVLRTASIIGNTLPVWLLDEVCGNTAGPALLRDLAEQDFLFSDPAGGALRFKHGITRDVVYATIGLHERRAMHLRVAIAMHGREGVDLQDICEALAYHYGAGGSAAEAALFAERAGDKALRASALDRAQLHFRAALEAIDPLAAEPGAYSRWMAIAQRLGLVCVFDPSRSHLALLRRAVTLASARGDTAAVAQAEYWLGYIEYGLGEPRVAQDHCERALQAVGADGHGPLAVQIRATLGQALATSGDYGRALPLLDEAIRIKQSHRSGSRPAVGLSYTLACRAGVLGDRGHFDDAQALFDQAIELVLGSNHEVEASVLGWRSLVYMWQGRWDEAAAAAAAARRMAERVKSLYIFAMNQAMGAWALWSRDGQPASLQALQDATRWLERGERRLNISLNHAWLAEALFDSARHTAMRHHAALALARARRFDRLGRASTYRTLARAAAEQGDGRGTARYLGLALQAASARQSPHESAVTRLCAARIAARQGQSAAARAHLDQALRGFDTMHMAWHRLQAERLLQNL